VFEEYFVFAKEGDIGRAHICLPLDDSDKQILLISQALELADIICSFGGKVSLESPWGSHIIASLVVAQSLPKWDLQTCQIVFCC